MLLIVGLVLATLHPALGEIKPCCGANSSVILLMNEGFRCYEVERNLTYSLSIQCQDHEEHYLDEYNYTINGAGELLLVSEFGPEEPVKNSEYCLSKHLQQLEPEKVEKDFILKCDKDIDEESSHTFAYCMAVSAAFYYLIAIIYTALSELRDLTGKSIICMCASLGIALSVLTSLQLIIPEDMNLCAARGFISYFFFIASFFWMNVISLECYYSITRLSTPDYGWHRFIRYFGYAYGMALLCVVILLIVNYAPGEHHKPQIGVDHCWFINVNQQWIYFYSVMTIIMFANLGIFIYISISIYRANFSSNSVRASKFKLFMSIKLFVIMGLPWALEIISRLVEDPSSQSHLFQDIIDVVTSLQGLVMFIVLVVLRKRCLKAMQRRGWFLCLSDYIEKHLAVADDEEGNIVQHTDLPLDSNVPQ